MSDPMSIFTQRLYTDWLPSFCNATHRNYSLQGFKDTSITNLNEFDAGWFIKAVDSCLVSESNGFFSAPQSKAKEQIFWEGRKAINPRPITLWIEPIITIGALARLNEEFKWPTENLGAQSKTWAFDLVCYDHTYRNEHIVCEVKKNTQEIIDLLYFMLLHCLKNPLNTEPANPKERNAYRKIQGIRRTWPSIFWAVGPRGESHVFHIRRDGHSQRFYLDQVNENSLIYKYI